MIRAALTFLLLAACAAPAPQLPQGFDPSFDDFGAEP